MDIESEKKTALARQYATIEELSANFRHQQEAKKRAFFDLVETFAKIQLGLTNINPNFDLRATVEGDTLLLNGYTNPNARLDDYCEPVEVINGILRQEAHLHLGLYTSAYARWHFKAERSNTYGLIRYHIDLQNCKDIQFRERSREHTQLMTFWIPQILTEVPHCFTYDKPNVS